MKVLLLNDGGTPTGGAQLTTLTVRDGLRARGHDALMFSGSARPGGAEIAADLTCFGTTKPRLQMLTRTVNPSAFLALKRLLREFRPDVVHVRMFLGQLSPMILPLLRPYPSLYHATMYEAICPTGQKILPDGSVCREPAGLACLRSCLSIQAWAASMLQRRLWRAWRGAFDAIVANSRSTARALEADGIGPAEVIWNGVPSRPARPPLSGPPTVAFASRLVPEKGGDVLLRAFAEVVRSVPDARLIIAGDGPDRPRLENLVRSLELTDRVELLGQIPRDRLDEKLADAWVQAVPSLWDEPFGLVAPEALMRGTAVVASDSGGLAEIVEPGKTGLLVRPGDVEAWAGALRHLLADRELCEKMGREGRAVAQSRFDSEGFVDRFVDLYQSLIDRRAEQVSRVAVSRRCPDAEALTVLAQESPR